MKKGLFRLASPLLAIIFLLSLFPTGLIKPAQALTGVTLADNDTTGFGLDGRDFTVTWTPETEPAGYLGTFIFVVQNSQELTLESLEGEAGCGGSGCYDMGGFFNYSVSSYTLPQFVNQKKDSAGLAWATDTAYKACIAVMAGTSSLTCSSSFTPTSDSPEDSNSPFIEHMSNFSGPVNADLSMYLIVRDDQTSAEEFAAGTNGAIIQGVGRIGGTGDFNPTTATQVSGSLYSISVPNASLPDTPGPSAYIEYYFYAKDKAGNESFFCSNPEADTATECQTSPLRINLVAAGERTISGKITDQRVTNLDGVNVYLGGYAAPAVTTDGSGNYSFSGIPNNTGLDIIAYKSGYCNMSRFEPIASSNLTGINITIPQGECGMSEGGEGGMSGKPHKTFSGPPENSANVPLDTVVRVGFDQALNPDTINDSDATDEGSGIYLSAFDSEGETKIAGSVTYCENNQVPGCDALYDMDANVILFTPTSNLTANKSYVMVIGGAVLSVSGQPIEGNLDSGGLRIPFSTGGGTFDAGTISGNYGQGGAYMPPFIETTIPAPGMSIAPNAKIILIFSDTMNTSTLTSANIKLKNSSNQNQAVSLSVDTDSQRVVTIDPTGDLPAGEYEIQVLGGVSNINGVTMRPPDQASQIAFSNTFRISGSNDVTAPTIYPELASGAANVPVNKGTFRFGFSEPMDPSTLDTTNITMSRGGTSVPVSLEYEPGTNEVFITPLDVLAPGPTYTISFSVGVADLAGRPLSATQNFTYTTGSSDTVKPKLKEVRCDDYSCFISFNEPMNNKSAAEGTAFDASVLKAGNITLNIEQDTVGSEDFSGVDVIDADTILTYEPTKYAVYAENLGLSAEQISRKFKLTVATTAADLSGNVVDDTSSANIFYGQIENSTQTYGNFDSGGMFGPPMGEFGDMETGFEFKPEGFGNFTTNQFFNGEAAMAFPFNNMAGMDANVFQLRFSPGIALLDGDIIELTLPTGTTVTNAAPDTYSPYFKDFNESTGVVDFDTTYSDDGVSSDNTKGIISIKLDVVGELTAADPITIDLKKIINPSIPKGPDTGGYTVGIKVKRNDTYLVNKTSMPFFIMAGGSNTISLEVFAGSAGSPNNVSGTVYLFGGGPAGPMDRVLTITAGAISAIDGTSGTSVDYGDLPDGCYFLGTDPYITLSGVDYMGQTSPEPICVNGGQTVNKDIILSSLSAAGASVAVTVKLVDGEGDPADFDASNLDIFAGGPGKFIVKNIPNLEVAAEEGYTLRLPLNGHWFIGVGPETARGPSTTMPTQLPSTPPPPVDINVTGLGTDGAAISAGFAAPQGVAIDAATKTITFTFETADKTISGQVTDGTNPLPDVDVFVHSKGFGSPTFSKTSSTGTFSIPVSSYGPYEIGAFKYGINPVFYPIEVKPDGSDAGTVEDIYFKGKQITGGNPLVITLKKPDYSISGKILDASGNGIGYAPVNATDADGNFIGGMTSSDGSYTLFVNAGTWTIKSPPPPDKTDMCVTISGTVVITTASKANQNISAATGTCYALRGAVSVGTGDSLNTLENSPVTIMEWNAVTDEPVAGGLFKHTSTDSSGNYRANVAGGATYRVEVWTPDYGILSAVTSGNVSEETVLDVTSPTMETITFTFTGGTADMIATIELKDIADQNNSYRKQVIGLNNPVTLSMPDGDYNYFVNVKGASSISPGIVPADGNITIDLSTSDFITVSGSVFDDANTALSGAQVTLTNSTTGVVESASTDESGAYSLSAIAGTYRINVSRSGYVAGDAPTEIILSQANAATLADYDFGGLTPDQDGLYDSTNVIEGTLLQSDGTPFEEGMVTAVNADEVVVTATIDSDDGAFTLPVINGSWTLTGVGPLHTSTQATSATTVNGADVNFGSFRLTADTQNIPEGTSAVVTANSGGTVNDITGSGITLTTGPGVLESGSGDVTVTLEKNFTAPDTTFFDAIGGSTFEITADGTSMIKELRGNAEITIDYTELIADLPAGVDEDELILAYYSPETNEYIPVEGGFTIDTTNNRVTGLVDHFTEFALVTPENESGNDSAPSSDTPSGGSSGKKSTLTEDGNTALQPAFEDSATHWAKDYINRIYELGIVNGYDSTHFGPDNKITRAELTKVAMKAFNLVDENMVVDSNPFPDVPATEWFAKYIKVAKDNKIVEGYSDGTFKPNDHINRVDALKILLAASGLTINPTVIAPFPDVEKNIWYTAYVYFAYEQGFISGYTDGTFGPGKDITRAEIAKIVTLILDYKNSVSSADSEVDDVIDQIEESLT